MFVSTAVTASYQRQRLGQGLRWEAADPDCILCIGWGGKEVGEPSVTGKLASELPC